jgi:trigger factor
MKLNIKNLPQSEMELNFELTPEEWGKFINEAINELVKDSKIDGFRPGKAPREMVEQKVGQGKILEQAAELAVRQTYSQAILENKIEAIGQPCIHILKLALGNPFEFKVEVAVMPEIKLTDYKKIAKAEPQKKADDIKVEEKELADTLKWLAQSRAKFLTVTRPAQMGDMVEIDFVIKKDGQQIEGGESKNHPLILGENRFMPGFEEQFVGLKEKEEKKFPLVFPPDYKPKELAGVLAECEVKMNLVQERLLPELDDEFAKSLGKFENFAALKQSVSDNLEQEKLLKEKEIWRAKVLEKIAQDSQMELPAVLIEAEKKMMSRELEASLADIGLDLAGYLRNIKKTEEELKAGWQEKAKQRLRASLALGAIARDEAIEVFDKEAQEETNRVLARYASLEQAEHVDIKQLLEYTKVRMRNEKVFQFLENF